MTSYLAKSNSSSDAIILAVLVSVCVYIECSGEIVRDTVHAVPLGHKLSLVS